ncbi:MAG: globin [Anaerolineae bacterium]|nr:globin [Chloroflexota bacterium]MBP6298611.1 globin [Anaerolineae bacterium]
MTESNLTVYEMVGGDAPFRVLVDTFYDYVEADPVLRPMFPDDLGPGREHQFLFLTQFFGGPARYSEERGHPRLRMRHGPFAISREMKDHWLRHMLQALDDSGISEPAISAMRDYFERGAEFLINRHDSEAANGE